MQLQVCQAVGWLFADWLNDRLMDRSWTAHGPLMDCSLLVAPTVVLDSCSDGALTDCWLCMKCRLTVHCLFRIKNGIEKTIAELREDPNIGAEVRNQEFKYHRRAF